MPTVYLDPSVVVRASATDGHEPATALAPGAVEALRQLTGMSCEVLVLGVAADLGRELPEGVTVAAELPSTLAADAWFLTADPLSPFGRPRGARTVLVGPRRQEGRLPLPRYDLQARDLGSAVLEILTLTALE